jgi:RNA polymerase sigma-70 factor (ECF subfamily)
MGRRRWHEIAPHKLGNRWEITAEENVLNKELHTKLEDAVLALPKPYRLILILLDMEQLGTREVAEVMGISEETTKTRLHRARVFLRNALAGYVQRTQGKDHA